MSIPVSRVSLPADWVPVERRWFGLDRRTILPSVIAVLLIIVLTGVLPAIDNAIQVDREMQPGDIVNLGSGLTFAAPEGWNLADGILTTETSVSGAENALNLRATLTDRGVTINAVTGPFTGTPDALLVQVHRLNEAFKRIDDSKALGDPGSLTTSSGLVGLGQTFSGANVEGIIAVFVLGGIGVEFVIHGPPGALTDTVQTVATMFDSLSYTKPGA